MGERGEKGSAVFIFTAFRLLFAWVLLVYMYISWRVFLSLFCGLLLLPTGSHRRTFYFKNTSKALSYPEALRCALQIAEALRYLHNDALPGNNETPFPPILHASCLILGQHTVALPACHHMNVNVVMAILQVMR